MASKSSVSALQEYCAQHKIPPPTYDYIDAEDGSFVCRAQVMNMEADAQGRSKRDAKHMAASNLIKRIRKDYPEIDNIRPVEHNAGMPTVDMIVTLRDYCVQNQHPLPIFEIVQQGGTPDTPEFIAVCSVASIRRYGVSEKKKDAKQIAAMELFSIIHEDTKPLEHQMQVATVDTKSEDIESERYNKFKTYRELTESHSNYDPPGLFLCDRHNYFAKFHKHLREAAKEIINSRSYEEDLEGQVRDLFHALKITPRIKYLIGEKSVEQVVQIETDCEYDVIFSNVRGKVYSNVLSYFRDMID